MIISKKITFRSMVFIMHFLVSGTMNGDVKLTIGLCV